MALSNPHPYCNTISSLPQGEHSPPQPGSTLSGHELGGADVAQDDVDQYVVVEAAPKHAVGLLLGGEGGEDHELLGKRIKSEVEAGDGEGARLQGGEAQGDGGVEEDVVVAGGIVERLRGGWCVAICTV